MKTNKNKIKSRGFSLIEVVISMVILSMVSLLFVDTLVIAADSLGLFEKRKESLYMVQFALRRILKDCRYVKRGGFILAEAQKINFKDSFGRDLSFRLNGENLEISTDGGNQYSILSRQIGNFSLTYYDKLNNRITTPVSTSSLGNIQWMEISVGALDHLFNYKNTAKVFPREMYR